eukprot:scaffold35192_cov64-Phaeocystis_antarctica.AAC.14
MATAVVQLHLLHVGVICVSCRVSLAVFSSGNRDWDQRDRRRHPEHRDQAAEQRRVPRRCQVVMVEVHVVEARSDVIRHKRQEIGGLVAQGEQRAERELRALQADAHRRLLP